MRKTLLSVMIVLSVASGLWASSDTMSGIKLLPGYRAKRGQAVDAAVWTIERDGGPIIEFESGPSEGSFPDPKERDLYSWHREQVINGFKVRLALIKPGVETIWEPENRRGLKPGGILLVTFLLGGHKDSTANFTAKIGSSEELADVLLMVLTFDPSKGAY